MIELAPQTLSIQSLYSWYRENRLHVNRRYQRKLVWTLHEKQKLIESILKRYPIPAILLAEREAEAGTYEIIDGLQRLHAILSFIETSFSTLDHELFALQHFPTAQVGADEGLFLPTKGEKYLSQREVGTLLDYALSVSVMRNSTLADINDVFGRINSYGHQLSDQERRQAGVQNDFSNMVRLVACTVRGDVSTDSLPLSDMPSISIDLPMSKHGYLVHADEVFWVEQGVLRSTDLRDSMDEQCIADIAACVVSGSLIERSKDALDAIYDAKKPDSQNMCVSLEVYGAEKFAQEFTYCIEQILKVVQADPKPGKLRDLLFAKATTNPIPSVFAIVFIAFHELLIKESNVIADYRGIRAALDNLNPRLSTGRSIEDRRSNVNVVKGLVGPFFIPVKPPLPIYSGHAAIDIEGLIRRSEIELAHYELKQGLLTLSDNREIDPDIIEKVAKTICAIANNGPEGGGKILIGVTDKQSDAERVEALDAIKPKKVGKRFVVGIGREAAVLGIGMEEYVSKWKNGIKGAPLSDDLKNSVLSRLDFNDFYGLGVLVITIPPHQEVSYWNEKVYWREGDSTLLADTPKLITGIAKRF